MSVFKPVELGGYKLNPKAVIPTKTENNAGYDIYTTDEYVLQGGETHLFPTGLAAVVEPGWGLMGCDRGSTGSKGIHIHCGVVDNNYRGEIFICLHNDNCYPIKFTDAEEAGFHKHKEIQMVDAPRTADGMSLSIYQTAEVEIIDYFVYPLSKAIAQLVLIPQPPVRSKELNFEEWEVLKMTDRGDGKLGSSGK